MWLRYIYVLFEYLRAGPLFGKFTLISPPSHPLNLASPIFMISNNVIALHLCSFYVLFRFLRAEPLFKKFTLFSTLSHRLILASPLFTILKNVIALYLCAFRISKSWTAIWNIYPDFTPESPSEFGITNFCDIKQCNCAIFMCFSKI